MSFGKTVFRLIRTAADRRKKNGFFMINGINKTLIKNLMKIGKNWFQIPSASWLTNSRPPRPEPLDYHIIIPYICAPKREFVLDDLQ